MKHNYVGILILVFLCLTKGLLTAQCNYTTAVPYYESFETITTTNQFPTCWSASNPSVTCLTYTTSSTLNRVPRTGSKFASFFASPTGTNYFYTNGIQLVAGITYSASMWYTTEFNGYTNWSDLSILVGSSQASTGLVSVVSSGGPAVSNIYKSLSGTFSVATSGIYYAAIRAANNSSTLAQYLSFDDFRLDLICNVSLTVSPNTATVCQGQSVTFTVSGADTYTWSDGHIGPTNTFSSSFPGFSSISVIGTQTSTGCQSTSTINLQTNPAPQVNVIGSPLIICSGDSTKLQVFGGSTYTLLPNQVISNTVFVSPTITTTYTLMASNQYGCTQPQLITVTVNPLPAVSASMSGLTNSVCAGDEVVLTGHGALSYKWIWPGGSLLGSPVTVHPNTSITYTLEGNDGNSCKGVTLLEVNVSECVGIDRFSVARGLIVCPNPFSGSFIVKTENGIGHLWELGDVTGRKILSGTFETSETEINLDGFVAGVYFLRIPSNESRTVIKLIKQ